MDKLQVIEIQGQRVLTTKQLAEMYNTTQEKIRWNYKYNKSKYVEGKHYILVEGQQLKQLKRECEFQTLLKQAKAYASGPKKELCCMRRASTPTKHGRYMIIWLTIISGQRTGKIRWQRNRRPELKKNW